MTKTFNVWPTHEAGGLSNEITPTFPSGFEIKSIDHNNDGTELTVISDDFSGDWTGWTETS